MKQFAAILAVFAATVFNALPAACEVGAPKEPSGVQARAAQDYLDTGDRFFGKGEYETAIASYDKAQDLDPELVTAINNKGVALFNLGRYAEAVGCFDRLISVKPDDPLAYVNKGNALSELGRFDEASDSFREAVRLNPASAAGYNFLGLALDRMEKHDAAIDAYDSAIKLNPRMPEPLNNKAYSLICLKKYGKALECLNAALAIQPGYRFALINKAFALQLRGGEGDGVKAEVILNGILNTDCSDIIAARAYALLGKKDEMLAVINSLLLDNPGLAKDFRGNIKFERYWGDPEFNALVGE